MTNTNVKKRISIKKQTVAAVLAIIAAVALPQLLHAIGISTGTGASLSETFLPMHLPVLFTGLIAGPFAGAAAGLVSPLVSFALTGMPSALLLPFMMLELFVYGLASGLVKDVKIPTIGKVFTAQLAGRAVRAIAILGAALIPGISAPSASIIWTSVQTGIIGILIQLILIPLAIYCIDKAGNND
ncbi:MAG: ECF transporter S component [Ruminococcus sp.]|nr:ECF transporter S component [Ruminococcus sp.]